MTLAPACVSVRLRELREDRAPLQPHPPVRLRHRGLPPHLCVRGGGPQDGGEPTVDLPAPGGPTATSVCCTNRKKLIAKPARCRGAANQTTASLFFGREGGANWVQECALSTLATKGFLQGISFFKFLLLKFHLQAYHGPDHLEEYILEM